MTVSKNVEESIYISVENIGGIDEATVNIPPGVTILEGRNATNRTSLLQAIIAAIGGDNVTLKGDADKGHVKLTVGDDTYIRALERTENGIVFTGNPHTDDPTTANLFAFLLESNPARQAVKQKQDLRELIMKPIKVDDIKTRINELKSRKKSIDQKLKNLDDLKGKLTSLESQRASLNEEIRKKKKRLTQKEDEIDKIDADISQTRSEKEELESRLNDLRSLRSELENVRSEIDLQKNSIQSLRTERSRLQEELSELPETPKEDYRYIDNKINQLREQKRELEEDVSGLQDVIQFNEQMLSGEAEAVTSTLSNPDASDQTLTDQLVEDQATVCWTCGSEVQKDQLNETIEQLRAVQQDHLDSIEEVENKLRDLQNKKQQKESQRQQQKQAKERLSEIEDEIKQREEKTKNLRQRSSEVNKEIKSVEKEVERLESEDFSEILDLHKEANQLEFELNQAESKLDNVNEQVAKIENKLSEEEALREQKKEVKRELQEQRTRIERIEQSAIEQFNEHMAEILDLLEYKNINRIWIERAHETVRDGRKKVEQSTFRLHVVRSTETDVTYEDTVDHLSESEREVTGLIFALAGYLVHDVHEEIPVMLLDSLEAIDSRRLSRLIDYFADYSDYLITALLPEDAQAVSDVDARVTDI